MLDTNKITVENIKATVNKVKTWVINLYPMLFIGSSTFEIASHKGYSNANIILSKNSSGDTFNVNSDSFDVTSGSNSMGIFDSEVRLITANGGFKSNAESTRLTSNNTTKISNDASMIATDNANKIISGESGEYEFKVGDASLKIVDGDMIFNGGSGSGRLILGNTTPTTNVKNGLYSGHATHVGYTVENSTTCNLDGTATYRQVYTTTNLGYGSWLFNVSLSTSSSLGDGKRLGLALQNDGVILPELTSIVTCGGAGNARASVSGTIEIPYGSTGSASTVQVMAFATTAIEATCNIKFTRLA